jgi:hypothetical protein
VRPFSLRKPSKTCAAPEPARIRPRVAR